MKGDGVGGGDGVVILAVVISTVGQSTMIIVLVRIIQDAYAISVESAKGSVLDTNALNTNVWNFIKLVAFTGINAFRQSKL